MTQRSAYITMETDLTEEEFGDWLLNHLKSISTVPGKTTIQVIEEVIPECCVCGTKENLHKDGWYGYRCSSIDCVCF